MKPQLYMLFITISLIYSTQCQPVQLEEVLSNPENNLALEAILGMGLRLQALQNKTMSKNFVVSPISATVVIAQMMLGAEGKFLDDLHQLLSLPNSPTAELVNNKNNKTMKLPYARFHFQLMSLLKALKKKKGEQFKLVQSSALFYNQNIELKGNFQYYLFRFYHTELWPLDFYKDTKSTINEWASKHTNGLVKNMISSNPSPDTSSIFMNSIYFLGEWNTPFSDELNREDEFYTSENTTVNITYMLGDLENIKYTQAKGYRVICLPYKNEELGMYIMFPNQDHKYKYDIKKFVEELNTTELLDSISKMKNYDVLVRIPKLSLSNTMSMLGPLQQYAALRKEEKQQSNATKVDEKLNPLEVLKEKIDIYKNFTGPTNTDILLTVAAKSETLRVSDILQNIVFSINEKGTEAAAVTAGITDYMGGSKTVILNRPFLFLVRHEATMATLFWGTISDPSSR